MPIGKPVQTQKHGAPGRHVTKPVIEEESVFTEKQRGRRTPVVVKTDQKAYALAPKSFDRPYAMVDVELGSSMSIKYQGVNSRVRISMPCYPEDVEETTSAVANMVEHKLSDRAEWAAEVIKTLWQIRDEAEGQ